MATVSKKCERCGKRRSVAYVYSKWLCQDCAHIATQLPEKILGHPVKVVDELPRRIEK